MNQGNVVYCLPVLLCRLEVNVFRHSPGLLVQPMTKTVDDAQYFYLAARQESYLQSNLTLHMLLLGF